MSRRSQVGNIEVSGKWYVVRFWKDVPGQENRVHACERICPVGGSDCLTKAERKRRALEIVAKSGVNSQERFIEATVGITFREQAKWFICQALTRKRKPIKPATVSTWQNCLDKWLNPHLGDMPLANVNNGSIKTLVSQMYAAGLSAKSIVNYSGLVKLVVASAVDNDGDQLFPRRWNHEFIDMPVVENQNQPTFSAETVTSIIAKADGQERILYALLAGTGLRVGEALGLEIGKHISEDCRTLYIRQSVWQGDTQTPKTENSKRDVDLSSCLGEMLKAHIGDRTVGFLFASLKGNPLSQSNVLRRDLHPILAELGVNKAGFHTFRRFRATFLSKSRVPEALVKFWLGHANKSVTDEYIKMFNEVRFRRDVADQIGVGFDIPNPAFVRIVRRNEVEVESEVVA
jgi:integrase